MFVVYLLIFTVITIILVTIMMVIFGKFEFRFNRPRNFWKGALAVWKAYPTPTYPS
jgi:hypothetical protein